MDVGVLPWVLSARIDGGLDSRLRGNDGSWGLRRLRRDCPERAVQGANRAVRGALGKNNCTIGDASWQEGDFSGRDDSKAGSRSKSSESVFTGFKDAQDWGLVGEAPKSEESRSGQRLCHYVATGKRAGAFLRRQRQGYLKDSGTFSVVTRVTPQPAIQQEWRPSPPATSTTTSLAERTMGTMTSSRDSSIQAGQVRLP